MEREKIVDALNDLAVALELELNNYNAGKAIHEKQLGFHKDISRNRWIFGGNRTGKTECGAVETVWWALGNHRFRKISKDTIGWVVSLSAQVQRDVAQKKILKYLPADCIKEIVMQKGSKQNAQSGVIDFIRVLNRTGGESIIAFKSVEQGREKFQGTSLDYVWFDEEPPEDVYRECQLRVMDKGGSIWGTMTPLKGRTWVFEQIFLRATGVDISVHSFSWENNPFLPKAEIARMEKELSEEELETRKYGRFMQGTGIVFSEFSDENIVGELPPLRDMEIAISIDPGYVAPTAILFIGKTPSGDIYVLSDYSESNLMISDHVRAILSRCESMGLDLAHCTVLMDSASLQRTLGSPESVASKFRALGLQVDTNVEKALIPGIMRMKSLFCNSQMQRQLFIHESCTNLIRELRTYYWGEDERPVKKDDHCIDALRYYISTIAGRPNMKRENKTAQSEFKKKLLRGIK